MYFIPNIYFFISALSLQTSYIGIGPCPMQLVVVIAVRNAVSAATITFTAVSRKSFLFIVIYFLGVKGVKEVNEVKTILALTANHSSFFIFN